MQKFDDLQKTIEKNLAKRLRKTLVIWPRTDWNNTWKPRYERLSAYRNFLTHNNSPQVMLQALPTGDCAAYVPHENHFFMYRNLSWQEQEQRFATNRSEWDLLSTVCERVHAQTISWLNDAYNEMLKCLNPLVTDEDYQDLWGWDTNKHGTHRARSAAPMAGAQGQICSGQGIAQTPSGPRIHDPHGSGFKITGP